MTLPIISAIILWTYGYYRRIEFSFDLSELSVWYEPKEDIKWLMKHGNSRDRFAYYFGTEALNKMDELYGK